MVLVGADALCPGKVNKNGAEFRSVGAERLYEPDGPYRGFIEFKCHKVGDDATAVRKITLACAP